MKYLQKYSVFIVSVCFILLCIRLVRAYHDESINIEQGYRNNTSVNLDKDVKAEDIKAVLLQRGYLSDVADAELISHTLADSLHNGKSLEKLSDLRLNKWKLPIAVVLERGGNGLKGKANQVRKTVGQDYSVVGTELSEIDIASGTGSITVLVKDNDSAVAGVTVLLRRHFFDDSGLSEDSVMASATTSTNGKVTFKGLDTAASYSVLPVRDGYEYGSSKGTTGGTLGRTRSADKLKENIKWLFDKQHGQLQFTFRQKQLRMALFDDATIRAIHDDHAFTLRTPEQWKVYVTRSATYFLLCWFFLCFVLWMRRRKDAVYWPVASLMGITGIGLLGMMSYNDPFVDKLIASDYLTGVLIGVVAMAFMQFFDLKNFFRSKLFDIIGTKIGRKGLGYFIIAIILTLLLFPLGQSVGGARVNLNLGIIFQPSEIVKYLMVFFMSAWFCRKADTLVGYSAEWNGNMFWSKMRHISDILIALFCMLLLYIMLKDMGPALVLIFSFIIIYSVAKSKITLEKKDLGFRTEILKSDIFLLLIGILSFLLILWIGDILHTKGLFAVLWFIVWIAFWAIKKRVFVETPVITNIVISVFVFARNLPGSIGERFAMRSEMCNNPWGSLGLDGTMSNPTPNGQVAEGLWGLASGGLCGQGFSNGSPNYIPAFHTDMVLSSLGEQMGLIGLGVAVLLLLSLLHHTVAVGFNSRHNFSFFVCLGIAVVTAVQFVIIALGSNGVIPLTGVAVPLLSYGKVSMIMTLAAFGIVLSVESHTFAPREDSAADQAAMNVFRQYDAPVAVTRTIWFVLTLFIIGVMAKTMVFTRNSTLIRPLFVTTKLGENIIQYNPRIADITRAIQSGNIYDRNGLLLATSTPDSVHAAEYARCGVYSNEISEILKRRTRRYYPLGNRLLFMVGDANQVAPLTYNEASPVGYLAESQHLSYLRGFDNVLYLDKEHTQPCYVDIESNRYVADRYQPTIQLSKNNVIVRDYSALLPLLKAGRDSKRIERVNSGKSRTIKPQDLHLTLDATLQCRLQDRIEQYVNKQHPNHWLMRVSVVVLDASSGDMLASALYPLPNKDTLQAHSDEKYYNDSQLASGQKAYTDRDLGLTYLTAPGSTAKVMTAMAGLQKEGRRAAQQTFIIPPAEQVEIGIEPTGNVSMERAIVMSSNCYFIHLMNHFNLYSALDSIYSASGVQIGGIVNGYSCLITPYFMHYAPLTGEHYSKWKDIVSRQEVEGLSHYQSYMNQRNRDLKNAKKMNYGSWQWAWGQGSLAASPLSMTRIVSTIVNGGVMPKTRFQLNEPVEDGIRLISNESANLLKGYLHTMAEGANGNPVNAIHDPAVGGKTGTPERVFRKGLKKNDGWFIFYVDDCTVRTGNHTEGHPLAVAVRMEREVGSGPAMCLSRDVVLPVLEELGYKK
ncbi:MAG: FtsW/RodA/SpoVE family cell cycle protein [Bacteroidales bacterium]|nr:FtsW/RodA/SpoVE family cell cycle protein [Bacteroidales bacterium]